MSGMPADLPRTAPRRCPCCDGERFAPAERAGRSGRFGVERCLGCGLRVTAPAPRPEELPAFYPPEHYGAGRARYRPAAEWLARRFRDRRAAWIAGLRPAGAVLDVGCGNGYMLAGLRARGWRVQGVELTDDGAAYARRTLGLPVAVGPLGSLGLAEGSFDVVVFWQSFEHLPDPRGTLATAARLLRPGGLVVVSVPNASSWQARWAGPDWFHWELPRHLYHWDPATLAALFARVGLDVVRVRHANWEQNPFGWTQSMLNRLGFPPNALFHGLWAEGDAGAGRGLQRLLAAPLGAAGFALAAVETLCRRGGTITIVGRRAAA
jgi:SAM-dependent methyltransferase